MTRGTKVKKNCSACGDIINVRLADHKRGWGKFCDKMCKSAFGYGHRPHDVNQRHADNGMSIWATVRHEWFEEHYGKGGKPPIAPSIQEQLGKKVRVKKIKRKRPYDKRLHNRNCVECGEPSGSRRKCLHHEVMDSLDGWDYKDNYGY